MSESRGNYAALVVATLLLSLVLLLHCGPAQATSYTVGDSTGWRFNVAGWENGKIFKAGDTLVFKYTQAHSVVVVDKASYDSCIVPPNATKFTSGDDTVTLEKGPNYFICGTPGHCQSGMKIDASVV